MDRKHPHDEPPKETPLFDQYDGEEENPWEPDDLEEYNRDEALDYTEED